MKKKEKTVRYILIALCELLTLVNVLRFSITGQWNRLLLALLTLVLILVPEGIERLFHCRISLVCGNNKSLHQKLTAKYSDRSHVHILGFVQNISLLMDSADLFVTKPGGLSSTEAAVKCLPAVYLNAVGGCENYNLEFFVQRDCAALADSTDHAAELCRNLIQNTKKLEQMRQALKKLQLPNAGKIIFDVMNDIKR